MAKIGENFPLSRAARKANLDQIKQSKPISKSKVPGKGWMNVFRIPLKDLSYNPYNTRFLAQAKTLERRFGCKLSDENPEHLKAIEKFIWNEKPEKNQSTIDSLIRDGQLQPGVVTADGIILAGNRRFRLLNEIDRNPDKYEGPRITNIGLDHFEAVILDDAQLERKDIIEYESFYQFGIEDKVEYDPIQKYIAAHFQKEEMNFTTKQIARHFISITKGETAKVDEWLEVYEYMEQYLKYIEEEGIYTALEGREEAFIRLRLLLKSLNGKAGSNIWAFNDFDIADLKKIYFDYIRLNIPTHDFRQFKDIFSEEEQWKNFRTKETNIIEHENNQVDSFDDFRERYPDYEETDVSKTRQNDYKQKVESGLNRIFEIEKTRIQDAKSQELPLEILKSIQQKLNKLEADMSTNGSKDIYDSEEFLDAIRDIQKRIGRIKQKVD